MTKEIKNVAKRPPVVVILGHVDHGKTSLLDYIRKSNVAVREAGGITQKIGASVITTEDGRQITFIDTPGHAAFSNMRSRGAKVADIAVLVVAANEGIKPQTKEALEYIIGAKIPYIVAATKVDLSGASADMVKDQLSKAGVMFEDFGGDVPLIEVSVRQEKGVKEVLEMINLLSDLHEVKGSADNPLEAFVIETSKEKSGMTISAVVKDGALRVGDLLVTESIKGKVRGLFNYKGEQVKEIIPGMPAQLLGFDTLPPAGSRIWSESGSEVLPIVTKKNEITEVASDAKLNLILKTGSTGSLEAIIGGLSKEVGLLLSGVGEVNESDVFLAKSGNAYIFVFEAKLPNQVSRLADMEGVKIEEFNIIYRLFERVEELLKKDDVEILGEAEIIAEFPYEGKRVAGSRVKKGIIAAKSTLSLSRGEKLLGEVKVLSLKKAKQEVQEVKPGEEFGIFFAPQLDFKVGDVLTSIRKS